MTDINKVIMEKAQGGVKLNPDEQRRFLGTFEERVLASCSIEQANETLIRSSEFGVAKNTFFKGAKKASLFVWI